MSSPLLRDFYSSARPGFCPCGDPLPDNPRGRKRTLCDDCRPSYGAIYYAAMKRRQAEASAPVREFRRLERLAFLAVRRAVGALR